MDKKIVILQNIQFQKWLYLKKTNKNKYHCYISNLTLTKIAVANLQGKTPNYQKYLYLYLHL